MGVVASSDPLVGGFYSTQDAARLLGSNAERVRRWVAGDSHGEPVILRDYEPVDSKQALSFWDLMEVRFLEHFRNQGVSLQTLRKAAVKARIDMQSRHPFALSNVRFLTDRRKVFGHAAKEAGDEETWDLVTNQYEMYAALEAAVAEGVAFNPVTGLAEQWKPLPKFRNVIIHPRFAFGRPVIGARRVPTKALYRMWKAEGGDKSRVAKAYGVGPREVREAVSFEETLAAAA